MFYSFSFFPFLGGCERLLSFCPILRSCSCFVIDNSLPCHFTFRDIKYVLATRLSYFLSVYRFISSFFLLFAKNSKKGICPPFQFLWGFIFPTISASLKWSGDISFFGRKIFFCEHTTQRYPFPCTTVQYIYELFYMFVDKRRQDEVSERINEQGSKKLKQKQVQTIKNVEKYQNTLEEKT